MSDLTKDGLLEVVTVAVPYSSQLRAWNTQSEEDAVRFTWRGNRYRVSLPSLMVDECDGRMLSGSDIAILMEALLKMAYVRMMERDAKGAKP